MFVFVTLHLPTFYINYRRCMQCDEKEEVQRIDPVEVQNFSREIRSSGSPERKTCETANKTVTSAIAGAGRTKPSYKHHGAEEDEEQGRRLDPSSRKIPPRRSAQNSLKPFNRRSKLKELRSRSCWKETRMLRSPGYLFSH